jgi:hypothetical protein
MEAVDKDTVCENPQAYPLGSVGFKLGFFFLFSNALPIRPISPSTVMNVATSIDKQYIDV